MSIDPLTLENLNNYGYAAAAKTPTAGENSGFSDALLRASTRSGTIDLDAIFDAAARIYDISPSLLKAVAKAESGFRPDALSKAGAMGIMQLMPGTAKSLGVTDAYDPEQNIMGGARFLKQLMDRFDGDVRLALAAYNAGANNVEKYGGIPPFSETQNYVRIVLGYLSGDDITAGLTEYSGTNNTKGASGSAAFKEAFAQMLLMKIIEMQMNSSEDDDKKVF